MADAIEELFEQGQGQAAARFAIGRCRKVLAGQTGNRRASDVAMEDLNKKGIDGVDGIKNAFAMNVIEVIANSLDYLGRKSLANILLETSDNICDGNGHPWPPRLMKEIVHTLPSTREATGLYKSI